MAQKFIENNFTIRYCYKYKGVSYELCYCGKKRKFHEEVPTEDENWSLENNTRIKVCDVYGNIKFTGYDCLSPEICPYFIRFNCEKNPEIYQAVLILLSRVWNFPTPKLLITVSGDFKRMYFKNNEEKKIFKQGLIEVMKKDKTWIIGSGFNVGMHKLISEAVYEYRIHHDGKEDQVKLIGISTWGIVQNNEKLVSNEPIYPNTFITEKGKLPLDAFYDCFLFCDDGTEKQFDKEMQFRLNFEKYLQEQEELFAVQILFEGGKRAIENAYMYLKKSIPVVIIKGSGKGADIIYEVLQLPKKTCKMNIKALLEEYEIELKILENEISVFQDYLYEIYTDYKSQIVFYDILDKSMKLDKKILEAMISRQNVSSLENTLNLAIRFDCHDIAEKRVFQNSKFRFISRPILSKNFKEVLEMNRPEFVKLFLENNFDIEEFLNDQILLDLYKKSLSTENCRCAHLINDLILSEDKFFKTDSMSMNTIKIIYKIICRLSGNILAEKKYLETTQNALRVNHSQNSQYGVKMSSLLISYKNVITCQDLFLWALLSGYTELATIIWKIGKDHISSALIGSIILNRMRILILKRGYSDVSEKLRDASKKFQEMAKVIVTEAYKLSQEKTYTILVRALKQWNHMTCLQIAISGNLLDFLNTSACRSYTRQAWMGELSPFLPTWKILLTIPFSLILIKPLVIPSFPHKKSIKESRSIRGNENQSSSDEYFYNSRVKLKSHNVTFNEAIKKFYQAPIVKFVVHLVSYILFLFVFIYFNLVELEFADPFKFTNMKAEIFVYINIFGIIIEEIRQIVDQERAEYIHKFKAYFSGSWNIYDMSVISVSIISIILRFTLTNNHFIIVRSFFAVTLSMFCLRTMQFYFINPFIGPKVIMIRKMIVDILFFLSIFVLFVISYGTLAQSLGKPNAVWDLTLFTNIFYQPYFQTYGELMLDDIGITKNCSVTECRIKNATITISFGIFLLLTNVLLINLLIAMFGHTFKKIQEESEKFFTFIQIQLVEEFHEKPLTPPPLNIVFYFIMGILNCGNYIFNKEGRQQKSFLVKHLPQHETIKITGFEQTCMESSIFETKETKESEKFSKIDFLSLKTQEWIDKINDIQEFNQSLKSIRTSFRASNFNRLEKLEEYMENFRSKIPGY